MMTRVECLKRELAALQELGIETPEEEKEFRKLMDEHNQLTGRRDVRQNMIRQKHSESPSASGRYRYEHLKDKGMHKTFGDH